MARHSVGQPFYLALFFILLFILSWSRPFLNTCPTADSKSSVPTNVSPQKTAGGEYLVNCSRVRPTETETIENLGLVAKKTLRPLIVFWDAVGNRPEFDWMFSVLLAKLERPIFVVKNETELGDLTQDFDRLDLLYVYTEIWAPGLSASEFFQNNGIYKVRERWGSRLRLCLFQFSDELVGSTRGYKVADYVYRNYWSAELEKKITLIQQNNTNLKVRWMILGFRNVRPHSQGRMVPASMRPIACNFYGNWKLGNRPQLKEALEKQPRIRSPSQETIACHGTDGNYVDASSYQEILYNSVFTLCPTGFGDETYRVAEALSSGSIPIMVTSYYSAKWLSNSPLIILDSWDGINEFITTQVANATHLDLQQAAVAQWWHNYKSELQSEILKDVGSGDE